MNYGFVKVAAAVPRVKVADCKFNSERLEGLITIAEGKGPPGAGRRPRLSGRHAAGQGGADGAG